MPSVRVMDYVMAVLTVLGILGVSVVIWMACDSGVSCFS